jgi:uracil-DNA glycosylase
MKPEAKLAALLAEVGACRLCAALLPHEPRPVVRASRTASILIIGQAPGRRVHETGIPWNDPSGGRLRSWLALDRDAFYDERRIAIMPMGFCFPGTDPKGGDYPPRPECAPHWHLRIRALMPNLSLTLLVGSYAQAHYLGKARKPSMTETVRAFRDYLPDYLPLPHPSWRNTVWLKRNPWFEAALLPELRRRSGKALGG